MRDNACCKAQESGVGRLLASYIYVQIHRGDAHNKQGVFTVARYKYLTLKSQFFHSISLTCFNLPAAMVAQTAPQESSPLNLKTIDAGFDFFLRHMTTGNSPLASSAHKRVSEMAAPSTAQGVKARLSLSHLLALQTPFIVCTTRRWRWRERIR